MTNKVCPVVCRVSDGVVELLAFEHPSAGKQFVKGGIKEGESPREAAIRELAEESGIIAVSNLLDVGTANIGSSTWHFYTARTEVLPDRWEFQTCDDFGHVFSFFWHPLAADLDEEWHPLFHAAMNVIRGALRLEG